MYEVFWTALRLGLTAFGGPIAHLGYFERTYVRRLRWLGSEEFASLVALCQTLPGPTSSQVGFLIGRHRAGWPGALAAWVGFTLPSAVLMYAFAVLPLRNSGGLMDPILHGLMVTAVAVVAQAVWSMARGLCPDWPRRLIAALSGVVLLLAANPSLQLAVMIFGAIAGLLLCRIARNNASECPTRDESRRIAGGALLLYTLLLAAFGTISLLAAHGPVSLAAVFYRAGALVFGGGHVVLPLLRQELVPSGWLSDNAFLSGYGLAQGLPGPLFTVAAYLGAASAPAHLSALWACIALAAIFLPGLLLAAGGASLWNLLAHIRGASAALAGINASVVGILGAAFYDPVWRSGVRDPVDVGVALVAFALLQRWRFSAPVVAALCVAVSLLREHFL